MEQQQLEKTAKGLEAITRLLDSLYYAPTHTGFFRGDYDPYTVELRAFVQQVLSGIPESHHAKHSATYLDGLTEDSSNDLKEILYMAKNLEAEVEHAQAIAKLKKLCHHLLTDPDPTTDLDPSQASQAE